MKFQPSHVLFLILDIAHGVSDGPTFPNTDSFTTGLDVLQFHPRLGFYSNPYFYEIKNIL